ncbi:unnamed protein product [Mytilus coruscus]|uniref:Uncharacterized protein n=1 Tax=Mytilus coruscus TaxID=42192 RepID=A0A6J8CNR7_MYTCO|nr:unnamed protein product [Mytilus coruscus]
MNNGYAIYVWRDGYDPTIPGCSQSDFLNWDKHSKCFTHTWDTHSRRQWLWNTSADEKFDGVAVNNEAYASLKCHSGQSEQIRYLQNLNMMKTEAMKQVHGHLLTHYSVSWHWGRCGSTQKLITYNGKTQDAVRHMVDIFDSIDVQGDPCHTTFFPSSCNKGNHTEAGMFDVFDHFKNNGIEQALPCIHYFRGIYSSGGNPDWPIL